MRTWKLTTIAASVTADAPVETSLTGAAETVSAAVAGLADAGRDAIVQADIATLDRVELTLDDVLVARLVVPAATARDETARGALLDSLDRAAAGLAHDAEDGAAMGEGRE